MHNSNLTIQCTALNSNKESIIRFWVFYLIVQILIAVVLIGFLSLVQEADANTTSGPDELLPETQASTLDWTVTPFFWMVSLDGDATIKDVQSDINIDFLDVVKESDTLLGLMAQVESGTDEAALFLTIAYTHVGFDGQKGSVGPVNIESDITADLGWFELATVFSLIDKQIPSSDKNITRRLVLDTYIGARLTVIDMELDTDASVFGIPTSSAKRDLTEIWVEPIIGLRSGYEISNDLFIHSRYDIGGFGAGSDFAWQAMANLAFKPKF
jgi:hypothetical protein